MDLYALPPEEFTAARDAEAREARRGGDRTRAAELAALRRPTVSAYAVNALVRAEPALVDQLLELGGQLASAQSAGEGEALRALGAQRRQLVEAVVDRAQVAAGRTLVPGARAEVTATLEAALADPGTAEAVRSGRLVRALAYAGFGGVDLEGAVAAGGSVPTPSRARPGRRAPADPDGERHAAEQRAAAEREAEQRAERDRRRAEAERAARDAAGELDDAVRAAEQAEDARAAAQRAADEAGERVVAAEQALALAREEREEAQAQARGAGRHLERAHVRVREAQSAAEQARARLDRV